MYGLRFADVRHLWPLQGPAVYQRDFAQLIGAAVHHDAAIMAPGDRDFNGSTLDEDLERLEAIHRHSLTQGWGTFPYHMMASPNGRLFYTLDLRYYGAQVARRNHETVGLALMGDFTSRHPGDGQLCAAAMGLVVMMRRAGRLLALKGHREWALPGHGTACPGDTWWGWQNRLWASVGAQARRSSPN